MVGLRRCCKPLVHRNSEILQGPPPQEPNAWSMPSLKKKKAVECTYRIIPRGRLSQCCIILSQFHPSPNDDLVQQQRLPIGINTLVTRVVVRPKQ